MGVHSGYTPRDGSLHGLSHGHPLFMGRMPPPVLCAGIFLFFFVWVLVVPQ